MSVAPGYAEVSLQLQHIQLPRPCFVVFGVNPTETDPDAVGQAVFTAFTNPTSIITQIDSEVTLGPTTVHLGTDGGEDLVGIWTETKPGTRAGTGPPPNVAVLARKRTARGGRRGRGRMYLPWAVTNTNIGENGQLLPAVIATLNGHLGTLRTNLSAAAVPMVVLHNPGVSSMGAPDVVTSITVDPLIATQRRRLGR